jgi:hypothetical protein
MVMARKTSCIGIAFVALAAWIGLAPPALATAVRLTPNYDYPGATIQVKGNHFGVSEPVDVYFDMTDELLVTTNIHGAFANHKLSVPASTLPGEHWVTAIGRKSGLAAQALLTVSTDWAMFQFSNNRNGDNTHENVLSASNVSSLGSYWGVLALNLLSSPAVANG